MDYKRTLLLTYDYELFLGRSGSVDNCLIKPTNELMKVMKNHGAHGTFFVDTVYLLRVKEENYADYKKVERQLLDLLTEGHRIELHLHPHWVDANYNSVENQWYFDNFRYYRVGSCPEDLIDSLFAQSVELLSGICFQVDSNYKPFAYRAGGWCIEPFKAFEKLFKKYGIVVDSSVLPLQVYNDLVQGYDYRSISMNTAYRFSDSPLSPNSNGCFVEIPVTSFKLSIFNILKHRVNMKLNKSDYNIMGDGMSSLALNRRSDNSSSLQSLTTKIIAPQWKSLAFEGASYGYPSRYYRSSGVYTSITHPKLVSRHSLREMSRVLDLMDSADTIKDFIKKNCIIENCDCAG